MDAPGRRRLFLGAFGDPGHAFPMLALGERLAARGHDVTLQSWERWREHTERGGMRFSAAPEYHVFPTRRRPLKPYAAAARAAAETAPMIAEEGFDAVVADILTLAPALAGEMAGVPVATLVPHVFPAGMPGQPPYSIGARLPRTPVGRALWRALEEWSRQVRREAGFHEVRTPSLVRRELWETSGHWANYQDNMFVLDDYDHVSGLKPMNCPQEILIYRTRARPYRDLPMRFADYSTLFRKERSGVLAGMFRVRQLTQDDSHVFCRDDQVDDEIRLALSLVRTQYAPFGFEPRAKLATRPETRLGSDEFWERAEARLRERLEEDGMSYTLDPGGGAFYAPKVDIFIEDALGREWQMATIQADYQLPQRFDLEYRAADGGFERPVVIHYAIYGSFERFIGIITEHYTGAFPLWLAPVQVMVVPIADRHLEYAESVRGALAGAGLRAEVDGRSERMQAKLREAQEQKVPVMVVVGDRDAEAGAVSPRLRTGESSQGVPLDEFVADVRGRNASRELWPVAPEGGSAA